ncbi:RNA polymerase sigma factor SigI [Rossellomorea aquimaris]|jgi:RNA polymerase sigma factor|uniref:RNA polymerase sigma factor SigI n=1 Tax=Rossellomorea aquimaris TaxID=189382 RepID=A0A1J6W2R7_9BACI|nr:RNA polymerase sigma factor SigI [Rossellomorea aquimaris]OIU72446.1 RNA polymerase sigma-I factor [Rossellomorea aquimaris]
MLNLLLFLLTKRMKKPSLEELALDIQGGNEQLLNTVINDYKPFVKKTVSSVCKRYIYESDDEFSIGLIAFNDAILKYSHDRGSSILSFAEVIIKRKVIDYIRKNGKYQDISMDRSHMEDDADSPGLTVEQLVSMDEFEKQMEIDKRREEIVDFKHHLSEYSLSFNELVDQSPKHEDARLNAIEIAKTVVTSNELMSYLKEKKRLPIKKLEKRVNVSRKTIERNRKYIIAISIIMSSDYMYLKDYLKGRLDR